MKRKPVPTIWGVRTIVRAFAHVFTGGATTRRRAVRRAAAPPARCPACRQKVLHSTNPADHHHL